MLKVFCFQKPIQDEVEICIEIDKKPKQCLKAFEGNHCSFDKIIHFSNE